jgi:hypothetical protein
VHDPSVAVDRTGTAAGEELLVTGGGWAAGAVLIVELCGHGGLDGSTDCDVGRQRTAGVGADGSFATPLVAGLPPRPCPCVIKATDQTSRLSATVPISVQGIPTVPITGADAPERRVDVQRVEVRGGSWTEWFGAASERIVAITLANTGDVTVDEPSLTVSWGRGARPTGFVEVPPVQAMAPGAVRTVEVAVTSGTFPFGSYTALAEIQGADGSSARATSTTYPWALLVTAAAALQVGLVRVRNRLRRRIAPERATGTSEPVLALPTGLAAESGELVIDLRGVDEPIDPGPVAIDLRERSRQELDVRWLAALTGDVDAAGDDASVDPLDALMAEQRRTMQVLTVDLTRAFGASAERVHDEVLALQRQVQAALDRAAELSEALFDAAVGRAEAHRARAAEQERLAAAARAEADELVRVAEARAEELVAAAEAAAADLLRATASRRTDELDARLADALARAVRTV